MENSLEKTGGPNIEEAAKMFWQLDTESQEAILSLLRSLLSER